MLGHFLMMSSPPCHSRNQPSYAYTLDPLESAWRVIICRRDQHMQKGLSSVHSETCNIPFVLAAHTSPLCLEYKCLDPSRSCLLLHEQLLHIDSNQLHTDSNQSWGAESSLPVAHPGYQVLSDILFRLGLIANALTQCSA